MMAEVEVAAVLGDIQEEARCPVCLDYLSDPVTTKCGHNFCRACINPCLPNGQDRFPCLVCRHQCTRDDLRSNGLLGGLAQTAAQLHRSLSHSPEETDLCAKHKQVLTLFCEQDLELLCVTCTCDHQGHLVKPVEQSAAQHRETLLQYSRGLRKQVARLEEDLEAQDRLHVELEEKVHSQREQLSLEIECMIRVVHREHRAARARMAQDKLGLELQLLRVGKACSQHISTAWHLLLEVTRESVMPDMRMLRGVRLLLSRCKSLRPLVFPALQVTRVGYSIPQHLSLERVRQKFAAEVTLDPESAHPNLLVSEDRKCVTFVQKGEAVPDPSRWMADVMVLGSETFNFGRHYWEVRVEDKVAWAVGICKAPLTQNRKWPLSLPLSCWAIGVLNGVFVAQSTALIPLGLLERPQGIGVYLDYEVGEISFYNTHDRSLIYSFTCQFSEELMPYFYIGCDSKPLIISAIRDHEEGAVADGGSACCDPTT